MTTQSKGWKSIIIPDGLIVFISGVPGMGKTTISYELLKNYVGEEKLLKYEN